MDLLLYLAALALVFWAQFKVKGAYQRYSAVENYRRINGAFVARRILDSQGLYDVQVEVSQSGVLSDHFDPRTNTVRLSPKVYNDTSIASIAIAAHEVGHAIQFANSYALITVRNTLLPLAIVSGNLGWMILIFGLFTGSNLLFGIGILMLGVIALFQLITLPIEFDASNRALVQLEEGGYLALDEIPDTKSMLNAAALTYVAALLATLLQILRFTLIANRRR
jgi:Zn-dependent membrane protease YugP